MQHKRWPIVALMLLLSACVSKIKVDSELARLDTPVDLPSGDNYSSQLENTDYLAEDATTWWLQFSNPVLDRLVNTAIENSRDLKLAASVLRQAQFANRAIRADRSPNLSLEAGGQTSDADIESNNFDSDSRTNSSNIDLTMRWQLDLFGRIKSQSNAAKASITQQQELVRDAQRLLVSQVVRNYYELRGTQLRLKLAQEREARRLLNAERINSLKASGYATALDQSRTDNQLYQTRADRANLELQEVQIRNNLAVLMGVSLAEIINLIDTDYSLSPVPVTAPLPSITQLIKHRPDLRASEQALYSAAYNVNAAKAALYPSFSISSTLGFNDEAFGNNPNLKLLSGSLLANLAMPILGRGRLLADIDINSESLTQAKLNYDAQVATALSEIDTSIVAMDKTRYIHQQRSLAASSARRAAELSRELFQAGELDYTSVIVAEQTRSSAEDIAIVSQLEALITYINYISAVAPKW